MEKKVNRMGIVLLLIAIGATLVMHEWVVLGALLFGTYLGAAITYQE